MVNVDGRWVEGAQLLIYMELTVRSLAKSGMEHSLTVNLNTNSDGDFRWLHWLPLTREA